jgi:transposase
VIDDRGEVLSNRNFRNDPAEFVPMLMTLEPGTPVAFEAAYGRGWLAELLDEFELEPHLAHAKACKAIASARLHPLLLWYLLVSTYLFQSGAGRSF